MGGTWDDTNPVQLAGSLRSRPRKIDSVDDKNHLCPFAKRPRNARILMNLRALLKNGRIRLKHRRFRTKKQGSDTRPMRHCPRSRFSESRVASIHRSGSGQWRINLSHASYVVPHLPRDSRKGRESRNGEVTSWLLGPLLYPSEANSRWPSRTAVPRLVGSRDSR